MVQSRTVAIVAFDDFTDIDLFLPWDLLNRVERPGWQIALLGQGHSVRSKTGLRVPLHGPLEEAGGADAVVVTSGPATRELHRDPAFLAALPLQPERQLIGSMCSGALILAAKGLLHGKRATTYPTAKDALERYGVEVVEQGFVAEGRIATAAGCLAAQALCGWIIERLADRRERDRVLASVQPVGQGLYFEGGAAAA